MELTEHGSPPGLTAGKHGDALDISSGGARATNIDYFNFEKSFYVAGWVSMPEFTSTNSTGIFVILGKYETSTPERSWEVGQSRTTSGAPPGFCLLLSSDGNDFAKIDSSIAIATDTWYLLEVFYDDEEKEAGIAVNNSNFDVVTFNGPVFQNNAFFRFGRRVGSTSVHASRIDSMGFWDDIPADLSPFSPFRQTLWNNGDGIGTPFE